MPIQTYIVLLLQVNIYHRSILVVGCQFPSERYDCYGELRSIFCLMMLWADTHPNSMAAVTNPSFSELLDLFPCAHSYPNSIFVIEDAIRVQIPHLLLRADVNPSSMCRWASISAQIQCLLLWGNTSLNSLLCGSIHFNFTTLGMGHYTSKLNTCLSGAISIRI